ncbi:MAG: hypothetical protein HQL76_06305 [Magnetococcales bacterium]|nr:hypothetical protein [Magnetococcales bacterium]
MPIENQQIKFMKSQTVSDAAGNGGRMSDLEAANGVKNNVWPDVPASERQNGSTKFRKIFIKVASPDNLMLKETRVFIQTPTPAGDRVVFFAGTQRDVQSEVSGIAQIQYGSGSLNAEVSAGASVITVNVEDPADAIFSPGQMIRISNKTSVEDLEGMEEFVSIDAVTWNGNLATLTLAAGTTLTNAYLAADTTRVASVFEYGEVWAKTSNYALSTTSGTFGGWNGSGSPPVTLTEARIADHIAGIEQTWTLTIGYYGQDFQCVGDTVGPLGQGQMAEPFAPNNPAHSRPYFTLPPSFWGGSWQNGEVVSFTTHPAAIPIWEKRIIPPGTDSLAGDRVVIGVAGESE